MLARSEMVAVLFADVLMADHVILVLESVDADLAGLDRTVMNVSIDFIFISSYF